MSSKHRRPRGPRRVVDRTERVPPTPETLAKLRPWPLAVLLQLGPEDGGLTAGQYEAALEIVAAWRVITADVALAHPDLGHVGGRSAGHEPSRRAEWLCEVWTVWSVEAPLPPAYLAEAIEDARPLPPVTLLARACDLWAKTADAISARTASA